MDRSALDYLSRNIGNDDKMLFPGDTSSTSPSSPMKYRPHPPPSPPSADEKLKNRRSKSGGNRKQKQNTSSPSPPLFHAIRNSSVVPSAALFEEKVRRMKEYEEARNEKLQREAEEKLKRRIEEQEKEREHQLEISRNLALAKSVPPSEPPLPQIPSPQASNSSSSPSRTSLRVNDHPSISPPARHVNDPRAICGEGSLNEASGRNNGSPSSPPIPQVPPPPPQSLRNRFVFGGASLSASSSTTPLSAAVGVIGVGSPLALTAAVLSKFEGSLRQQPKLGGVNELVLPLQSEGGLPSPHSTYSPQNDDWFSPSDQQQRSVPQRSSSAATAVACAHSPSPPPPRPTNSQSVSGSNNFEGGSLRARRVSSFISPSDPVSYSPQSKKSAISSDGGFGVMTEVHRCQRAPNEDDDDDVTNTVNQFISPNVVDDEKGEGNHHPNQNASTTSTIVAALNGDGIEVVEGTLNKISSPPVKKGPFENDEETADIPCLTDHNNHSGTVAFTEFDKDKSPQSVPVVVETPTHANSQRIGSPLPLSPPSILVMEDDEVNTGIPMMPFPTLPPSALAAMAEADEDPASSGTIVDEDEVPTDDDGGNDEIGLLPTTILPQEPSASIPADKTISSAALAEQQRRLNRMTVRERRLNYEEREGLLVAPPTVLESFGVAEQLVGAPRRVLEDHQQITMTSSPPPTPPSRSRRNSRATSMVLLSREAQLAMAVAIRPTPTRDDAPMELNPRFVPPPRFVVPPSTAVTPSTYAMKQVISKTRSLCRDHNIHVQEGAESAMDNNSNPHQQHHSNEGVNARGSNEPRPRRSSLHHPLMKLLQGKMEPSAHADENHSRHVDPSPQTKSEQATTSVRMTDICDDDEGSISTQPSESDSNCIDVFSVENDIPSPPVPFPATPKEAHSVASAGGSALKRRFSTAALLDGVIGGGHHSRTASAASSRQSTPRQGCSAPNHCGEESRLNSTVASRLSSRASSRSGADAQSRSPSCSAPFDGNSLSPFADTPQSDLLAPSLITGGNHLHRLDRLRSRRESVNSAASSTAATPPSQYGHLNSAQIKAHEEREEAKRLIKMKQDEEAWRRIISRDIDIPMRLGCGGDDRDQQALPTPPRCASRRNSAISFVNTAGNDGDEPAPPRSDDYLRRRRMSVNPEEAAATSIPTPSLFHNSSLPNEQSNVTPSSQLRDVAQQVDAAITRAGFIAKQMTDRTIKHFGLDASPHPSRRAMGDEDESSAKNYKDDEDGHCTPSTTAVFPAVFGSAVSHPSGIRKRRSSVSSNETPRKKDTDMPLNAMSPNGALQQASDPNEHIFCRDSHIGYPVEYVVGTAKYQKMREKDAAKVHKISKTGGDPQAGLA